MEWNTDVPLRDLTTFKAGGPAHRLVRVHSIKELADAVSEIGTDPTFVLGSGSNVLFPEAGFAGAVIKIDIPGIDATAEGATAIITAGAGVVWDDLVAYAVKNGWWGIENLSGIPGTVGATPIQNVGAYGVEVKDSIESVRVFDPTNRSERTLSNAECAFGYRDSAFKHALRHLIVTSVTFRLSIVPQPRIAYRDLANYFPGKQSVALSEIRDAVIAIRARKFPPLSEVGCAGSTFKNPIISAESFLKLQAQFPLIPSYPAGNGQVKIPLGYVLEQLGWKGYRHGDVGVWKEQALVVVNYGNATSDALRSLIQTIIDDMFEKTGVKIEPEIIIIE